MPSTIFEIEDMTGGIENCYYIINKNKSGSDYLLGLAQDLTAGNKKLILPIDGLYTLFNDTICFSPRNIVRIYLRRDERFALGKATETQSTESKHCHVEFTKSKSLVKVKYDNDEKFFIEDMV